MIYTLPDLPYDYNALEPFVSAEIVQLHHDKHHAGYVAGANTAAEKLAECREKNDFTAIPALERTLAFNLGGHVNHAMFWQNLSPEGGQPQSKLLAAIEADFGSFDIFKAQFSACANTIFGSGWAGLCYDQLSGKLVTTQIYDHQGNSPFGLTPILILDMWEHAFYLQYRNVKADYIKNWWSVINWADAAARFENAAAKK